MNLQTEMFPPSIQNNKMDLFFFEEILATSNILRHIQKQGTYLMDEFDVFMLDLFLLLYKKVVVFKEEDILRIGSLLIHTLHELPQTMKVRNRTAGSKYETYIIFKFFIDGLFEKLRGSDHLNELHDLLETLEEIHSYDDMDFSDLSLTEIKAEENILESLTGDETVLIQAIHNRYSKITSTDSDSSQTLHQLIHTSLDHHESTRAASEEDPLDSAIVQSYQKFKKEHQEKETPPNATAYLEQILFELSTRLKQEDSNAIITEEDTPASADANAGKAEGSFDQAFKEMIIDLEKRSNTEASHQILKTGSFKGKGLHWQSQAQDTSTTEAYQILDEKPLHVNAPHTEEVLRKEHAHAGQGYVDKLPTTLAPIEKQPSPKLQKLFETLKEPKIIQKQIQHTLQKKIAELHLDRVLNESISKVDRFNQHLNTLNIEKAQLQDRSFDDVMAFFKRLEDPLMIRFLNKVGRKKALAARAQYQKHHAKDIPTDRVILSDDLNNLVEEEFIPLALDIEAFENDFIDRFLHQNILTFDRISKTAKHKGPIILCYDGSGSMEGDKIQETKAHIIAFIEIARIQKRKLITIQFASANEDLYIQEIHPKRVTAETITDLLDTFIRGGTDFQKPLQKAMEYIQTDRYKHADILFITDGVCDISTSFKQRIMHMKEEKKFNLYTLIIHGNTYEDFRDIGQISDEVMEIKQRDLSDWNSKVSERIFSI